MNALADPEVGKYLNEYFVSAFQKVGTFRIVGRQKQGGNVASYFCAQDGRVLHVVAGPVNAATLLKEARWVVETVKKSLAEKEKNGKSFKTDQALPEVKELIGGYSVIAAESLEQATELAKGRPHLGSSPNARVLVREVVQPGG